MNAHRWFLAAWVTGPAFMIVGPTVMRFAPVSVGLACGFAVWWLSAWALKSKMN